MAISRFRNIKSVEDWGEEHLRESREKMRDRQMRAAEQRMIQPQEEPLPPQEQILTNAPQDAVRQREDYTLETAPSPRSEAGIRAAAMSAEAGRGLVSEPPALITQPRLPEVAAEGRMPTDAERMMGRIGPFAPSAPPPAPKSLVTAYTKDAQIDKIAKESVGPAGIPVGANTMFVRQLALQARDGGKRGQEAQTRLKELGVTASTADILGVSPQMQQMERERAKGSGLAPQRRAIYEQDAARASEVLTKQRNELIQAERFATSQLTTQLKRAEMQAKINALGYQAEDREYEIKERELKLLELEQKTEKTALDLQEQRALQADIAKLETENPVAKQLQTADQISAAASITDIELGVQDIAEVGALYPAIPKETVNTVMYAMGARPYDTPLQLAKAAVQAEYEDDVAGLTEPEIAEYREDAREAIKRGLPVEDAVKTILEENAGIDQGDKEKYAKAALAVSAAVMSEYADSGNAAFKEMQAQIQARRAAAQQTADTEVMSMAKNAESMGHQVLAGELAKSKEMLQKSELYGAAGKKQTAEQFDQAALARLGFTNPEDWPVERIQETAIRHLMSRYRNNPEVVMELSRMLDPMKRTDLETQALNDMLPLLLDGYKKREAEKLANEEKERERRQKIEEDAAAKNLIVGFDPVTGETKTFLPEDEELKSDWERASTDEKKLIEAKENYRIKQQVVNENGNAAFMALAPKMRDFIKNHISVTEIIKNMDDNTASIALWDMGIQLEKDEAITLANQYKKDYFTLPEQESKPEAKTAAEALPLVTTPAEFDALPDGAQFRDTAGNIRTKGA